MDNRSQRWSPRLKPMRVAASGPLVTNTIFKPLADVKQIAYQARSSHIRLPCTFSKPSSFQKNCIHNHMPKYRYFDWYRGLGYAKGAHALLNQPAETHHRPHRSLVFSASWISPLPCILFVNALLTHVNGHDSTEFVSSRSMLATDSCGSGMS